MKSLELRFRYRGLERFPRQRRAPCSAPRGMVSPSALGEASLARDLGSKKMRLQISSPCGLK